MSKRFICVLMALVVMLGAVGVSASGSMTIQEIVDQVVIPLALENDRGGAGFSRYFSYEDLAEIVRVFEENGFVLPENDVVMQFVTSGYGVPEGLVAERYCQQFFGPFGTWTDEQQGWYDDLEVRLGHAETFGSHVPGKDNMTREEAIAWALKKIREEYGEDLPLEDPDIWQITAMFIKDAPFGSDSHHEDEWSVFLEPKDLEHARYGASFIDRDPENSTELYYAFLDPEDAIVKADSRTLLVVVDTNRPEQVENAPLLEACTRVAVVDHHRRAASYIQNAALTFHEPYASSVCELMSELLQELTEPGDIIPQEAEAILAGIVLDTKNFSIRTGERTFDAAAFLRRMGADTTEVKKYMQSDMTQAVEKYRVLEEMKLYRDGIAIVAREEETDRVVAAQAADEMLNVAGVQASFVVYATASGGIVISARSIGEVNVQLILEKLGGGGNKSAAGVQIDDMTLRDAVNSLCASIDEYLKN